MADEREENKSGEAGAEDGDALNAGEGGKEDDAAGDAGKADAGKERPDGDAEGKASSGDGRKRAGKWITQGPPELRENPAFDGMERIGDLMKAHLDLVEKSKGGAEQPKAPAKMEDYKLELKAPKGFSIDPILEVEMRKVFHKQGLTQDQAAEITKVYNEQIIARIKRDVNTVRGLKADTTAKLKAEWKGEYEANRILARKGAIALFGHMKDEIKQGLGNHVGFIQGCARAGRLMREGRLLSGNTAAPAPAPRPGVLSYDKSPELNRSNNG